MPGPGVHPLAPVRIPCNLCRKCGVVQHGPGYRPCIARSPSPTRSLDEDTDTAAGSDTESIASSTSFPDSRGYDG
jgi:hypothetical protein